MHKFSEKIKRVMEENSEQVSYVWNGNSYLYGEIKKSAMALSSALKSEGDEPVILYGHKSVRMLISILACLFANRAYVPVDTYMPIERIKKIIAQTNATLILNNSDGILEEMNSFTLEEFYSKYNLNHREQINDNNIAYIIFTSGSTGEPKGVPISYDNLDNFVTWVNELIPNEEEKKLNILNQASFSFDLSVADLYYSLSNAHTLVALESAEMSNYDEIFTKIKNNRINMIVATPTFLKLLLLQKDFNEEDYLDLKIIYLCGETLECSVARKILERFHNIKLINAYGPTEATSAVSGIVIEKEMLEEKYLPVGKISTAATEIFIKDDEIVLKGNSVFGGYLSNHIGGYFISEEGENSYKTGDVGKIENDLLYCYGRKDNQIKYKGYRIELDDIERNIKNIEGINDAIVVAKTKENSNIIKLIKAYVISKNKIGEKLIKEKLKQSLPQYMIPSIIVIVDEFPVNNNGKIDRKKLSEI